MSPFKSLYNTTSILFVYYINLYPIQSWNRVRVSRVGFGSGSGSDSDLESGSGSGGGGAQCSSAQSERDFSSCGLTLTERRTLLSPETVEALEILYSAEKHQKKNLFD